jgi:hypothetical protein
MFPLFNKLSCPCNNSVTYKPHTSIIRESRFIDGEEQE